MSTDFLIAVDGNRTASLKKKIIHYYIANGDATIADLCKEMDLSIPTVTKLVGELLEEGYILDFGKQETSGGRKPNIYGLNPESGYFIGVDVRKDTVNIAIVDFKGKFVSIDEDVPYNLENTPAAFDKLCCLIEDFIATLKVPREKILSVGVNITGRVNPIPDIAIVSSILKKSHSPLFSKRDLKLRCILKMIHALWLMESI